MITFFKVVLCIHLLMAVGSVIVFVLRYMNNYGGMKEIYTIKLLIAWSIITMIIMTLLGIPAVMHGLLVAIKFNVPVKFVIKGWFGFHNPTDLETEKLLEDLNKHYEKVCAKN